MYRYSIFFRTTSSPLDTAQVITCSASPEADHGWRLTSHVRPHMRILSPCENSAVIASFDGARRTTMLCDSACSYLHEQARHVDSNGDVIDDFLEDISLGCDCRLGLGRPARRGKCCKSRSYLSKLSPALAFSHLAGALVVRARCVGRCAVSSDALLLLENG